MKTIFIVLLMSTICFGQVDFGTYMVNDSTSVTLGGAADTAYVYFQFGRTGRVYASTAWTYRGDASETDGYMNLMIYPDTVTTSSEMDSLEIFAQPVDEMGKVFYGPKVWCNFSQAVAEYDTSRQILNFSPGERYSCSLSGFTGPCYGIKVGIAHYCESDSDSIYVPIKLVK